VNVKLTISRTSINVNYVHSNSLIVKHVVAKINVIHVRLIIIGIMLIKNVNYVLNNSLIVKHVVMKMNVIPVRLIIIGMMMVRNV